MNKLMFPLCFWGLLCELQCVALIDSGFSPSKVSGSSAGAIVSCAYASVSEYIRGN